MDKGSEKQKGGMSQLLWGMLVAERGHGMMNMDALDAKLMELIPEGRDDLLDKPVSNDTLRALHLYARCDSSSEWTLLERRAVPSDMLPSGFAHGRQLCAASVGSKIGVLYGAPDDRDFERLFLFRRYETSGGQYVVDLAFVDSRSWYGKNGLEIDAAGEEMTACYPHAGGDMSPCVSASSVDGISRRFLFTVLLEMFEELDPTNKELNKHDKRTLKKIFDDEMRLLFGEIEAERRIVQRRKNIRISALAALAGVGLASGFMAYEMSCDGANSDSQSVQTAPDVYGVDQCDTGEETCLSDSEASVE